MEKKMTISRDAQVGILFFVVLVSLFILTVFIGDISFFKEHYAIMVEFDEVVGLQEGDKVLLSGVQVGKVETLQFQEGGAVLARLKIAQGPHRIFANSPVWIASTTPLGGKHIEIGRAPVGLEGPELPRDGTGRLKGGEPRDIGREIETAARKVGEIAGEGKDVLKKVSEGEGTIGALINDKTMAADVKETVRNIKEAAEKINAGDGVVGELLNNQETAQDLKEAIHNIKEITRKINEGEGALGKLVSDKKLGEKTESLIDSGNEAMRSIKRTFSIRTFLGIDSRAVPENEVLYSKIYLRLEPDPDKYYHVGAAIIDIDRDSPLTTPSRLAKISSDDEEIEFKVEILLGWRFFDRQLSFGAGLLEGQPGATLMIAPKTLANPGTMIEQTWFSLETRAPFETSDIDEQIGDAPLMTRVEIGTNLRFSERMPIVKIHVGTENILDDTVFMFGAGLELEDKDLKNLVGVLGSAF